MTSDADASVLDAAWGHISPARETTLGLGSFTRRRIERTIGLAAGAAGVISKASPIGDVIAAIHSVARGEPLRDDLEWKARGVKAQDVALPCGQRRVGEGTIALHRTGPLDVVERLAPCHGVDRRDDVADRRCLADHPRRPGREGLPDDCRPIGDAVDDDARAVGGEPVDVLCDGRAVTEGQVEHHDVRRRCRPERPPVQVRGYGGTREHDHEGAVALARRLQPEPHRLVVVDECDARHGAQVSGAPPSG